MASFPPADRPDLGRVFAHLDAMVDQIAAAADPLAALRSALDDYGRGNAGEGMRACRFLPARVGGLAGEWSVPPHADAVRRLLYLHGGGWSGGSAAGYRPLVAEIALLTGRPVLAVDYRLAPEHPYPAALDDALAALDWIEAHGPEAAGAAAEVGLAGDSAGGNLATAAVAERIAQGRPTPARLLLISALLDGRDPARRVEGVRDRVVTAEVLAGAFEAYRAGALDPADRRLSPAAADEALLARFPPTLIQVSAIEHLRDQSLALAARLWRGGVPAKLSVWPAMPHVWHFFLQDLPEARQALREIADFLA
ncbi:MAG: alpha/beta hydrolase fold domain-containing protein [Caulobacteraceae bacterium]|nr:alpha/beta hydrolase fold domain-containing protein [Caulobacteraceae bacterium]